MKTMLNGGRRTCAACNRGDHMDCTGCDCHVVNPRTGQSWEKTYGGPEKHGGRRPGAGRPFKPAGTKFIRKTVYLEPHNDTLIQEWNPQNDLAYSERLRQILDYVESETR